MPTPPTSAVRSMTGFGRGTARAGEAEATVEIRTVNGRYAEATVRGLGPLAGREAEAQRTVKEAIGRGTATVQVSVTSAGTGTGLRLDRAAAQAVGAMLRDAAQAAGLSPDSIRLDDVLRHGAVLVPDDAPRDDPDAWTAVQAALSDALGRLDTMRLAEGAALAADLAARADAIETAAAAVDRRAPARLDDARQRLRDRLAELADTPLDPGRLETEIALLADKLDVTEETVRLRSHLDQFRQALAAQGEPVGRRLNFLSQEIGREINTVGSKANDAEITRLAVAMKEELEKIREQVQNVV